PTWSKRCAPTSGRHIETRRTSSRRYRIASGASFVDEPISSQERHARQRWRRVLIGCGVVLAVTAAYAVSRLGRAAPAVAAEGLWIDTVEEGDISRELHGVGELVPDDDASRWASADVAGRVERKLLESGATVTEG